jgi:hypothetical protein
MSRFIIRYVVIENREVNLCNIKKNFAHSDSYSAGIGGIMVRAIP